MAVLSRATSSGRRTEKEVNLSEFCSVTWEGERDGKRTKLYVLRSFQKSGSGRDLPGQQEAALLQCTPSLEQAM